MLFLTLPVAAEDKLPADARAGRVVVMKKERTLTLMSGDRVLKTYKIALGGDPVGPKQQEGDHKTPEGTYVVDRHNPRSRFHRSLHISYPNDDDRVQARARGVSPGGDIMVHGLPNGFGWLGGSTPCERLDGRLYRRNERRDRRDLEWCRGRHAHRDQTVGSGQDAIARRR